MGKQQKRRKGTYAVRREKALELRDEARRLESQVAVLTLRSAGPGEEELEVDALRKQTEVENAEMRERIRAQQLHVAKMQSAVSQCLRSQQSYPLYTRICLPKDWNWRREKLISIRDEKLNNAYNFIMDPKRYVETDKTTYSDELFESEEGDFCGERFETV
ncbi:hypothetical protein V7S43_010978 [Phytophthora oleae]|uniref:Uncharacterized protein n=1 Tax=Phytophthora oleae TaxID=2107226 RepID=A0ABD3FBI1_9STRA